MKEIKPTYVTFEQAKWLKDKGYKSKSRYYDGSGKLVSVPNIPENDYRHTNNYMQTFRWEAPEQWQVVEWLRINHNIDLYVRKVRAMDNSTGYMWVIFEGDSLPISKKLDSPQEAYSAAFDYIRLNNLI